MKANKGQIERALDAPSADIRLILLHGPDESGSRALAARIERAMGPDAERIELDSATLKADPARLADEAASISLFGGARHIRIALTTAEEALPAIQALIEAPQAGNPAVAIAGNLRATSALLKYALAQPAILSFPSYEPNAQEADALATALAREAGLRLATSDVARRLAASAGGDRAIMAQEIGKFALYLDAAADRPATLDHGAIDLLGADADDGDTGGLVDAVMGGQPARVSEEIARLTSVGVDAIPMLRAVIKRALQLAQYRAEMDQGRSADAVLASAGKSLFWKDKVPVQRQLGLWRSERLTTAIARLLAAERAVKASGSLGPIGAEAALLTISRAAARARPT